MGLWVDVQVSGNDLVGTEKLMMTGRIIFFLPNNNLVFTMYLSFIECLM